MTDLRKAAQEAAKVLANALSIDFNDKRDWYSYKHDVEYATNLLLQALAQDEQEPVAWTVGGLITDFSRDFSAYKTKTYTVPLYTAPPKRKWVGLTDEDWHNLPTSNKQGCERDAEIFDWIEDKLKEKNK